MSEKGNMLHRSSQSRVFNRATAEGPGLECITHAVPGRVPRLLIKAGTLIFLIMGAVRMLWFAGQAATAEGSPVGQLILLLLGSAVALTGFAVAMLKNYLIIGPTSASFGRALFGYKLSGKTLQLPGDFKLGISSAQLLRSKMHEVLMASQSHGIVSVYYTTDDADARACLEAVKVMTSLDTIDSVDIIDKKTGQQN